VVRSKWLASSLYRKTGFTRRINKSKPENHFGRRLFLGSCSCYVRLLTFNINCRTPPFGFDLYFNRLSSDIAVLVPSSPCTIVGLRAAANLHLELWWKIAKRHAFRQWPILLDTSIGVFLVTKCVKTDRLAQCLTRGAQGSITQIRIEGLAAIPQLDQIVLPTAGTRWSVGARNDLHFEIHPELEGEDYTIFIERYACRMFNLTDPVLREAAVRLWKYILL
jgi:hypothetical protein